MEDPKMDDKFSKQGNVSEDELEKFAALSQEWWDPNGKCRPLHDLNPTRLQFITDRCRLSGKEVLDIGCGGGILSESMAKRGAKVTGIDMSTEILSVAIQHAESHQLSEHLQYIQTTAEDYAEIHSASFDIVTCMELLEHVPHPISLIKACRKLVKPEGHLFFSTINRNLKSYLLAIVGVEYALKLLPRGTHQYEKFIRPSELDEWLRAADLKLQELSGMTYNPFTRQASLKEDVSVNYLAYAVPNS